MPVRAAVGDEIATLEGLGTPEKPHPIQQAFIDEGAAQCGYCLSGVILTAKATLDVNPRASEEELREALGGVLCRCFAHTRMLKAIRKYADARLHESLKA
jgi:nicotinate dehydrogenase subunit A